jgi:hypothetical protein
MWLISFLSASPGMEILSDKWASRNTIRDVRMSLIEIGKSRREGPEPNSDQMTSADELL